MVVPAFRPSPCKIYGEKEYIKKVVSDVPMFSTGIVHGLQASAFFRYSELYYALIDIYEHKQSFIFNFDTYKGTFKRKDCGFCGSHGEPLFEYVVNISDRDSRKKLSFVFSPRIEGVLYSRKNDQTNTKAWRIDNPEQGEGVHVWISSSYNTPTEIENTLKNAFSALGLERFYSTWDKDETRIISFECYLRYNETKEKDIAQVINQIHQLHGLSENYKASYTIDKVGERVKLLRVVTDKWQDIGFENKQRFFYLKTYLGKHHPNITNPVLKQPKLEIGLEPGRYNKRNYPKWDEWSELFHFENTVLQNVSVWGKLTLKDLVEDAMFKVKPEVVYIREWQPKKLLRECYDNAKGVYPDLMDHYTKRKFVLLLTQKGTMDTDELMKGLELSRRQVFNIISFFEKNGIIEHFVSSRTVVRFRNPAIREDLTVKINQINGLCEVTEKVTTGSEKRKNIKIDLDLYEKLKSNKDKKGLTWAQYLLPLLE